MQVVKVGWENSLVETLEILQEQRKVPQIQLLRLQVLDAAVHDHG